MHILIFGRNGQVGRELLNRHPKDCKIRSLGRSDVDLSDPTSCQEVIMAHDADIVINAAAYTAVDQAEDEESQAEMINGEAPKRMAQACARKGIPFLHLSTDYVFDGSGDAPRKPNDPIAPLNAYGRSKAAGEAAVLAAGGRFVVLRTSWVFSAHGNNFVKTMLRLGRERQQLRIVSDQIGGPTSARAIADALYGIARQMIARDSLGGFYHFSGKPDVSWADFARSIFSQAGQTVAVTDILTSDFPTKAQRPLNSRLDCSTLQRDFTIERPDWGSCLRTVIRDLDDEDKA